MNNSQGTQGAARLFRVQSVVMLVMATVVMLFADARAAKSLILGGLVSMLPTAYFAWRMFSIRGSSAAQNIVGRFYKGEVIKILLTVGLFSLVFKYLSVTPLFFFTGFVVAQLCFWFAPLIFNHKQK